MWLVPFLNNLTHLFQMHLMHFIEAFNFVMKYFELITVSWTLIYCLVVTNYYKYKFHAKNVGKKFTGNIFLVNKCIFKAAVNQRYTVC